MQSSGDRVEDFAKVLHSRESLYRGILDFIAYELPALAAAATRNIYSFTETVYKSIIGNGMVLAAPYVTEFVAATVGKWVLPEEEHKNMKSYLLFQRKDLDSVEDCIEAKNRILKEEINDKKFLKTIYKGKENQEAKIKERVEELKASFESLEIDEAKVSLINRLKKAVIIAESLVEGIGWTLLPVSVRFFRKYVLGKNRFTGTAQYLSDKDNKKLGGQDHFTGIQKIGLTFSALVAPILNAVMLNLTDNKKAVENNKFLKMVKEHLDFTHGYFPKLGLLFSYLKIPIETAKIFTAQGSYELFERLIDLLTVTPSWWLGDRATNGTIAKSADAKLIAKYKDKYPDLEDGLLYVKEGDDKNLHWLEKAQRIFPLQALPQQIINKTQGRPDLREEALATHSSVMYKGLFSHSMLVFAVRMLVNWITKERVAHDLKSLKHK